MAESLSQHRPAPLTGALADRLAQCGWSFATGPALSALTLQTPPFPVDRDCRVQAYETISSLPASCNFGLILLKCGATGPELLPRHLQLPEGFALAGIAAAKRASLGPHPFSEHFGHAYRAQQHELRDLILSGAAPERAEFRKAPRLMLRCLLRQLAADHARTVACFAPLHDRPLALHLGCG